MDPAVAFTPLYHAAADLLRHDNVQLAVTNADGTLRVIERVHQAYTEPVSMTEQCIECAQGWPCSMERLRRTVEWIDEGGD